MTFVGRSLANQSDQTQKNIDLQRRSTLPSASLVKVSGVAEIMKHDNIQQEYT